VSGPFEVNDQPRVFPHDPFKPFPERLWVAVEVAIKAGYCSGFGGDNPIDLRVVVPGRDRDQAEG